MMRVYKELFLAPRFENIPDGLKTLPWAVWTAEPRTNKPGKFDKAPRSQKRGKKKGTEKEHLWENYEEGGEGYEGGGFTGEWVVRRVSG